MKKFVRLLMIFVMFSSVSYIILIVISGLLFPQWMKFNINYKIGSQGHMFTRLQEVKKIDSVDILFLGSSHAYRGFDPRCFQGYKTFNLGSSAQTPIQTKLLLSRYLDKLAPKTIIYEVYPLVFSFDGVESSTDIISNDRNDFLSLEMTMKINHIKVYNTFLYGVFREIFNLNKNFSEPIKKRLDTYIPGGYVEREVTYFTNENKLKTKTYNVREYQLETFEENIKLIKEKGIRLILVRAPIPSKIYNSYVDNEHYDNIMTAYDIPYYNFNKIINLNDSLHFYDRNHLNQKGVEVFNAKLLEIINE